MLIAVVGAPGIERRRSSFANIAFFAAAYFFGSTIRNRRLYMRAARGAGRVTRTRRDEEAKRAVADERLRIAQELHDVVAHSMGVIAVQAGVGAHVIDTDPAEAKERSRRSRRRAASTLTEIRRMLGVLREDDGAEYAPAPGLADLAASLATSRAAGLTVESNVEGDGTEFRPASTSPRTGSCRRR